MKVEAPGAKYDNVEVVFPPGRFLETYQYQLVEISASNRAIPFLVPILAVGTTAPAAALAETTPAVEIRLPNEAASGWKAFGYGRGTYDWVPLTSDADGVIDTDQIQTAIALAKSERRLVLGETVSSVRDAMQQQASGLADSFYDRIRQTA